LPENKEKLENNIDLKQKINSLKTNNSSKTTPVTNFNKDSEVNKLEKKFNNDMDLKIDSSISKPVQSRSMEMSRSINSLNNGATNGRGRGRGNKQINSERDDVIEVESGLKRKREEVSTNIDKTLANNIF